MSFIQHISDPFTSDLTALKEEIMTSQEAARIHELEDMGMHAEAHQVWRDSHRNDATYPVGTEDYAAHERCRKNLAGTHKGNLFCIDHSVLVAAAYEYGPACSCGEDCQS